MQFKSLLSVSILLFSSTIYAENNFYAGIKTGKAEVEFQDTGTPFGSITNRDSDTGSGFLIGYNYGALSMEFEHIKSDIKTANIIITDIIIESNALYGVYKAGTDLYLKIKLGFLNEKVIAKSWFVGDASASDSGLSAGIGAGLNLGNISIEAEYTIIETDVTYISTGINYYF